MATEHFSATSARLGGGGSCKEGQQKGPDLASRSVEGIAEVPELKLQFRLENAGPFRFKLPFHLNPSSLGDGQRKPRRVYLKVSSTLGTALLPSMLLASCISC